MDFTGVSGASRGQILGLMVNVNKWGFSDVNMVNCGILFEYCADSIKELRLDETSIDLVTKYAFVRNYPNMERLS